MKMTFGKHEGKDVSELSHEYCSNLLAFKFGQKRLTPDLEQALRARVAEIEADPNWINRRQELVDKAVSTISSQLADAMAKLGNSGSQD